MEADRHAEMTSKFTLSEEMSRAGLLQKRGLTDTAFTLLHLEQTRTGTTISSRRAAIKAFNLQDVAGTHK